MPTISFVIAATDADALSNLKFATVPVLGAILNVWLSSAAALSTWGISIGNLEIVSVGTRMNIEASADIIDTDRDGMVFDEIVDAGQLFMPITVVTGVQAMLALRYLG